MSHRRATTNESPYSSPPLHTLNLAPPSPSASTRSRSSLDASTFDLLSEDDCGDDVSSISNPSLHESVFGEPHALNNRWDVVDGKPRDILLGGESWSDADFHSSTLGSDPDAHGLEPSIFYSRSRRVENPFVDDGPTSSAYSSSAGTVNQSLAFLPPQTGLVFPRASPEGSYTAEPQLSAPEGIVTHDGVLGKSALNGIPTLRESSHSSSIRPSVQAWVAEHTRFIGGHYKFTPVAQKSANDSWSSPDLTVGGPPAAMQDGVQNDVAHGASGNRTLSVFTTVKLVSKQLSIPTGILAIAILVSSLLGHVGSPTSLMSTRPSPSVDLACINASTAWLGVDISTTASAAVGVSTQIGPDVQLIKHALAQTAVSPTVIVTEPPPLTAVKAHAPRSSSRETIVLPKHALGASAGSKALTIRNDVVALVATPPSALALVGHSWQSIRRKARGLTSASSCFEDGAGSSNSTKHPHGLSDCDCSLARHAQRVLRYHLNASRSNALQVMASTANTLRALQKSTLQYIDHLYGPALFELSREIRELKILLHSVLETSSTISTFLVQRSFRGMSVARAGYERIAREVRSLVPIESDPDGVEAEKTAGIADEAAARIAAVASEATDYLDETFRRAKGGLDKIVAKAKGVEAAHADLQDESVSSRWHRLGSGEYRLRGRRTRTRRDARIRTVHRNWTPPNPERPSRAQRFMDAVHHGAMAIVLR